jgi:Kelch motif
VRRGARGPDDPARSVVGGAAPTTVRAVRLVKIAAVAAVLVAGGVGSAAQPAWRPARPVPIPRTEIVAAPLGKEIAVVGGFLRTGANTGRADAYSPVRNRWRRLPDLPVTVDHAMAAGVAGRLYVVGGYGPGSIARDTAFAFHHGHWTPLPSMPAPRAAGGAAVVGGKLYVVGGVEAPGRLARDAFAFDFETARWTTIRGPRPREHLGAAALGGLVYVVAGRTGGLDSNLDIVEAFDPRSGRWRGIPRVPGKRGGTAAAAVAGRLLSVGGEEPGGTIRTVYAYSPRTRRWTQLPGMRTSRHGLGLVGWRGRAYALAGGPQPGLTVSGANEVLALSSK